MEFVEQLLNMGKINQKNIFLYKQNYNFFEGT